MSTKSQSAFFASYFTTGVNRTNRLKLWQDDCIALAQAVQLRNPPGRQLEGGQWSAKQHPGLMRSIAVRGLGLCTIPRLTKNAIAKRSISHFAALRAFVNTPYVIRLVLNFAAPYCTPTAEERGSVCSAVEEGNIQELEFYLHHGVSPNTRDVGGVTDCTEVIDGVSEALPLLQIAMVEEMEQIARLLLAAGADPNACTNVSHRSALSLAALIGDNETIELLLESGADATKKSISPITPLWTACECASEGYDEEYSDMFNEDILTLLHAGADVNEAIVGHKHRSAPPAGGGPPPPPPPGPTVMVDKGKTALFVAVREECNPIVRLLIWHGANVNARAEDGLVPLHVAVLNGAHDVARTLLEAGANVNCRQVKATGSSPLQMSVRDKMQATPLLMAADTDDGSMVDVLLEYDADVDASDAESGTTALYRAVLQGSTAIIAKLITAKADINKASSDKNATPLFAAVTQGQLPPIVALLDAGANKNIATAQGYSPLENALHTHPNNAPLITMLLSGGVHNLSITSDDARLVYAANLSHRNVYCRSFDPSELLSADSRSSSTRVGASTETLSRAAAPPPPPPPPPSPPSSSSGSSSSGSDSSGSDSSGRHEAVRTAAPQNSRHRVLTINITTPIGSVVKSIHITGSASIDEVSVSGRVLRTLVPWGQHGEHHPPAGPCGCANPHCTARQRAPGFEYTSNFVVPPLRCRSVAIARRAERRFLVRATRLGASQTGWTHLSFAGYRVEDIPQAEMDLMTNDLDVTGEEEAAEMKLTVKILTPETSTFSSTRTVGTMLEGTNVWATKRTFAGREESVILGVAAGSRVTSFDVATYMSRSTHQMCVEEVDMDGTVRATLIPWSSYGALCSNTGLPSDYTPATITVDTTATRFKVSARQTCSNGFIAGVAVFRVFGEASMERAPDPDELELDLDARAWYVLSRISNGRSIVVSSRPRSLTQLNDWVALGRLAPSHLVRHGERGELVAIGRVLREGGLDGADVVAPMVMATGGGDEEEEEEEEWHYDPTLRGEEVAVEDVAVEDVGEEKEKGEDGVCDERWACGVCNNLAADCSIGSTECAHCEQIVCKVHSVVCEVCHDVFCTFCSTWDYSCRYEVGLCISCSENK